MPKVRVKLTQQTTTIQGTQVVLEVLVALEKTGAGQSLVTTTGQKPELNLFVRPKKGTTATKIGSVTTLGQDGIKEVDGKPVFDLITGTSSREIQPADTDSSVRLTFDSATFKQGSDPFTTTMHLPWDPPGLKLTAQAGSNSTKTAAGQFELGAQLMVAGQEESAAFGDVADIPLHHAAVPDDFEPKIKRPCIGARVLYPANLRAHERAYPPTQNHKLAFGANTIQVMLLEVVQTRLNSLREKSFDSTVLQTQLAAIFAPVFARLTVELVPDTDPRRKDWKLADGEFVSAKVTDPSAPGDTEGHLVPFFQYWVGTTRKAPSDGELAVAERLSFDKQFENGQKRIQAAIMLAADGSSPFGQLYKAATDNTRRMTLVANVIGHEIGHCLGLGHPQTGEGKAFQLTAETGLMSQELNTPDIARKKLGPVHEALLKAHYG
ncbi:MAG TPA: hypothetical protein VI197_12605 [Polyangiaceae bacterium]